MRNRHGSTIRLEDVHLDVPQPHIDEGLFHGRGKIIVKSPHRAIEISGSHTTRKIECSTELVTRSDEVRHLAPFTILALADGTTNFVFMAWIAGGELAHRSKNPHAVLPAGINGPSQLPSGKSPDLIATMVNRAVNDMKIPARHVVVRINTRTRRDDNPNILGLPLHNGIGGERGGEIQLGDRILVDVSQYRFKRFSDGPEQVIVIRPNLGRSHDPGAVFHINSNGICMSAAYVDS